jgi:hypothetical protein
MARRADANRPLIGALVTPRLLVVPHLSSSGSSSSPLAKYSELELRALATDERGYGLARGHGRAARAGTAGVGHLDNAPWHRPRARTRSRGGGEGEGPRRGPALVGYDVRRRRDGRRTLHGCRVPPSPALGHLHTGLVQSHQRSSGTSRLVSADAGYAGQPLAEPSVDGQPHTSCLLGGERLFRALADQPPLERIGISFRRTLRIALLAQYGYAVAEVPPAPRAR